jgi:hypothetical protein
MTLLNALYLALQTLSLETSPTTTRFTTMTFAIIGPTTANQIKKKENEIMFNYDTKVLVKTIKAINYLDENLLRSLRVLDTMSELQDI